MLLQAVCHLAQCILFIQMQIPHSPISSGTMFYFSQQSFHHGEHFKLPLCFLNILYMHKNGKIQNTLFTCIKHKNFLVSKSHLLWLQMRYYISQAWEWRWQELSQCHQLQNLGCGSKQSVIMLCSLSCWPPLSQKSCCQCTKQHRAVAQGRTISCHQCHQMPYEWEIIKQPSDVKVSLNSYLQDIS